MENYKGEVFANIFVPLCIITAIILKIIGIIQVSWFWLFSPILIPFFLGCILVTVILTIITIKELIRFIKEKKDERY